MYSLIIFITLCLSQYIFYRWKITEVRRYKLVATSITNKKMLAKKSVIFLNNMLDIFKDVVWVGVGILMFFNLIFSIIIGTLIHFIVNLF